jgi:predicted dithiol-disulfide oxidoreductase (DUF899 family)
MKSHTIVTREQWRKHREALLAQEKELTHLREKLSEHRRELPWVRVEPRYVFEGPNGNVTLEELFEDRSQLVVYHVMFAPESKAACKSCSFWADAFDGMTPHLAHRDVTLAGISRAPLAMLEAFKARMGWKFPWYSCAGTSFNADFGTSFPEVADGREGTYNYGSERTADRDKPGISVFARAGGEVFHTYSCYARGIDMLNPTYQYLDLVPKGRDESELAFTMSWVRHHDAY